MGFASTTTKPRGLPLLPEIEGVSVAFIDVKFVSISCGSS